MALESHKKQQNSNRSLLKTLLILFISYTTVGLCNNGFFSVLPFVAEEFNLTRVQIGYFPAFYFTSAALLAIISGSIVDIFGPKKSILGGMCCMGITLFFYGLSPSYNLILFLAIFTGLGMSILTPSVVKGASRVVPSGKQSFYLGIVQTGYSVGSIVGPSLLTIIAFHFNWRISIQSIAVLTILIVFMTHIFYQERSIRPDNENFVDSTNVLEDENQLNIWISFKNTLLHALIDKSLFLTCILGMVYGIAEGSAFSHYTIFLTRDLGLSKIITGFGFAIIYIGGLIGMIALGWISDSFFKGNKPMFLFLIGLFAGVMYLIFGFLPHNPHINPLVIILPTFFLGVMAVGWSASYFIVVDELAGEQYAGLALGLALFFNRTGTLLAPIGFGYIADLNGNYRYSWLYFGLLIILISALYLFKINRA